MTRTPSPTWAWQRWEQKTPVILLLTRAKFTKLMSGITHLSCNKPTLTSLIRDVLCMSCALVFFNTAHGGPHHHSQGCELVKQGIRGLASMPV